MTFGEAQRSKILIMLFCASTLCKFLDHLLIMSHSPPHQSKQGPIRRAGSRKGVFSEFRVSSWTNKENSHQKATDVCKKDVWDFQASFQTSLEVRFSQGNEGGNGKNVSSQTWPESPRRPSPRHPRPPDHNSPPPHSKFHRFECEFSFLENPNLLK